MVEVNIMDTGGQERFNSIVSNYYKIADCCLLVYDVTRKNTLEKIKNFYLKELKEKGGYIRKIILLGNKTDLKDKRVVSQEDAIDLSVNEEYIYKETSCVNNENVADAFETIIEMWNIKNKQNKKAPIKRSKSKENLKEEDQEEDYTNNRAYSFSLTARNFSFNKKNNKEDKTILLKKNKKRKKFFC